MIKQKPKSIGIEIDLTSPQGNAFFLLGTAQKLCKQLHLDSQPILDDMKSGDYEHLVQVFDNHFGDFVTLYR